MRIEPCSPETRDQWERLRSRLWPHVSAQEHRRDVDRMLGQPEKYSAYIAFDGETAAGFAESSIRFDYVNGCDTSPVVFLEGVYVLPERRRMGTARKLCEAVEKWGRSHGFAEMASDALVENDDSHKMHEALGFRETERVVYFLKLLS